MFAFITLLYLRMGFLSFFSKEVALTHVEGIGAEKSRNLFLQLL